jgi:hypothetical protein
MVTGSQNSASNNVRMVLSRFTVTMIQSGRRSANQTSSSPWQRAHPEHCPESADVDVTPISDPARFGGGFIPAGSETGALEVVC